MRLLCQFCGIRRNERDEVKDLINESFQNYMKMKIRSAGAEYEQMVENVTDIFKYYMLKKTKRKKMIHYNLLHFVTLRLATTHYDPFHFFTLFHLTTCYSSLRSVTFPYNLLHFITLRSTTIRYISFQFVTNCYNLLQCVTIRYNSLPFITKIYLRITCNETFHDINMPWTLHYCTLCDYKSDRRYDRDKHVTRKHGIYKAPTNNFLQPEVA